MAQIETVTLYFRNGSSDKVYTLSLEQKAPGEFVVNYAYGKRGSTLRPGTKTKVPVSQPLAKRMYDKIKAEQLAEGYTVGEAGTPYALSGLESRHAGVPIQLLNPVDAKEADLLIHSLFYFAQEKYDGNRALLRKSEATVEGINRRGLTIGLPQTIMDAGAKCPARSFLLDGEAMGDVLYVFDLLELNGADLTKEPYHRRLDALYALMIAWQTEAVIAVETADSPVKKLAMLRRIKEAGGEGLVFKRSDAIHSAGRPASGGDQRKFKLYETASCLVERVNVQRSVALTLLDDTVRIGVGNVTIPPNQPLPAKGQVVEIRYLYAYKGGSLYQPTYLGIRTDMTEADCRLDQLKYKPEAVAA